MTIYICKHALAVAAALLNIIINVSVFIGSVKSASLLGVAFFGVTTAAATHLFNVAHEWKRNAHHGGEVDERSHA